MQIINTQINEFIATTSTGATITLGIKNVENYWIAFSGEQVLAQFINADDAHAYAHRIIYQIEDCQNAVVPNVAVIEEQVVQPAKKTPAKKTPAKKTPAKKTPAKKTPAKKTAVNNQQKKRK